MRSVERREEILRQMKEAMRSGNLSGEPEMEERGTGNLQESPAAGVDMIDNVQRKKKGKHQTVRTGSLHSM